MKRIYEFICTSCPFHFYLKHQWISTPRPSCPKCGGKSQVVELDEKVFSVAPEDHLRAQNIELKVNNFQDRERIVLGLINSGFIVWLEERKSGLTQTDYYIKISKEGVSFEGKLKQVGGNE